MDAFATNQVVFSFISLLIALAIYKYVEYKAVKVNWGSALEANKEKQATQSIMGLKDVEVTRHT
jgi:hypothetical protein